MNVQNYPLTDYLHTCSLQVQTQNPITCQKAFKLFTIAGSSLSLKSDMIAEETIFSGKW